MRGQERGALPKLAESSRPRPQLGEELAADRLREERPFVRGQLLGAGVRWTAELLERTPRSVPELGQCAGRERQRPGQRLPAMREAGMHERGDLARRSGSTAA